MLNAHLAHVIEVAHAVAARKLAARLALLRRLNILVRHKVVEYDRYSVLIENVCKARFLKLMNCDRRRDVVAEHDIQLCIDELTGGNFTETRVRRKDLLRHGHFHFSFPL